MKRTGFVFSGLLMIVCVLATHVATLQGGVVITGDVTPLPWPSDTYALIGYRTHGTLRVDAGSLLSTFIAVVGNDWLGVGDATVAGSGSNWTLYHLTVGSGGKGTLTVDAGGEVSTS
jgi:fibronectin-binding autotransporter adhesin